MNENIIKGTATEWKGRFKSAFAELTDNDLERIDGKVETLKGIAQKQYGYSEEEVEKRLKDFQ